MRTFKTIALLTLSLVLFSFACQGQSGSSFGLKAGLNYGANGDYFESISSNAQNPDGNIGYHIGLFGKFGNTIYLRPELVYTATKSEYSRGDFEIKKLDVPLLVGIKIIGPLSVFAGPSFQYILDTDFEGISARDIENDLSMGFNFGIGITLNKIGVDLRYERGFSSNETIFITNNNLDIVSIDSRPSQLILSVSLAL
ncbi:PorT family protein [Winogradskyella sp. DF17]|jgi:hypothetical protein|uniref:PorT family protein n=1 Tax=Winogradskyella pelagia TaxID=2819984 RepID=A0ABS3T552_9FLAO|nr:outer membrane beta-barrel protein [Winogradskyella sp. DF17]MBO3117852.1 PorT family protein [Winogradskyella sp. DF17]